MLMESNLDHELRPLKDNTLRAKWTIRLFALMSIVLLVCITSDSMQIGLVERIPFDSSVTEVELDSNDRRQLVVGFLYIMATSALAIAFVRWFSRAYHNLKRAGINLAYIPNMAAWSFFIPFINLIRPYSVAKEIVEKTTEELQERRPIYRTEAKKGLVLLWWCIYLLSGAIWRIGSKLESDAGSAEALIAATWTNIVAAATTLVAVALGMIMVSRMSRDEQELATAVEEAPERLD